jgi:hypothetical protein
VFLTERKWGKHILFKTREATGAYSAKKKRKEENPAKTRFFFVQNQSLLVKEEQQDGGEIRIRTYFWRKLKFTGFRIQSPFSFFAQKI